MSTSTLSADDINLAIGAGPAEIQSVSKAIPYLFVVDNQPVSTNTSPTAFSVSQYAPVSSSVVTDIARAGISGEFGPITVIEFVRQNPHCEQIVHSATPILVFPEPAMRLRHRGKSIVAAVTPATHNPVRNIQTNLPHSKCSVVNNMARARLMLFMNFVLDNTSMYEYANIVIINTCADIIPLRILAQYFPKRNFYVINHMTNAAELLNAQLLAQNLEVCKYSYTQLRERGINHVFDTELPNSRAVGNGSKSVGRARGNNLQPAYLISDIEIDAYILNELRAEAALIKVNILGGRRATLSYSVELAPWCCPLHMSYILVSRSSYINSIYVSSSDMCFRESIIEELNYIGEVARTCYYQYSPKISPKVRVDIEGWYDHCRDCVAEINILIKYLEYLTPKQTTHSDMPRASKKGSGAKTGSEAGYGAGPKTELVAEAYSVTSSTPLLLLAMNINYLLNSLNESRGYCEAGALEALWNQRLGEIDRKQPAILLVRNLAGLRSL